MLKCHGPFRGTAAIRWGSPFLAPFCSHLVNTVVIVAVELTVLKSGTAGSAAGLHSLPSDKKQDLDDHSVC